MSSYGLSRALYQLNDPDQRSRYTSARAAFAAEQPYLDDQERAMLVAGDVKGIHDRGVSVYLLRTLGYVLGLSFVELGVATGGKDPFDGSERLVESRLP